MLDKRKKLYKRERSKVAITRTDLDESEKRRASKFWIVYERRGLSSERYELTHSHNRYFVISTSSIVKSSGLMAVVSRRRKERELDWIEIIFVEQFRVSSSCIEWASASDGILSTLAISRTSRSSPETLNGDCRYFCTLNIHKIRKSQNFPFSEIENFPLHFHFSIHFWSGRFSSSIRIRDQNIDKWIFMERNLHTEICWASLLAARRRLS